ncbi:hypothetical protein KCU67_g70, partial [Aureobasidium melanogenum]
LDARHGSHENILCAYWVRAVITPADNLSNRDGSFRFDFRGKKKLTSRRTGKREGQPRDESLFIIHGKQKDSGIARQPFCKEHRSRIEYSVLRFAPCYGVAIAR